jgi:hypothetical protein
MRTILCLFALASAAMAQNTHSASKATTLSGAAEVVTIQGNAAANVRLAKQITFVGFDVYCSVDCTITLERDGIVATSTPLTPAATNSELPAATAQAFSSSNVGVGTVIGQYRISAGGTLPIKLTGKFLYLGGENLTIRSNSITGEIRINVQWNEEQSR